MSRCRCGRGLNSIIIISILHATLNDERKQEDLDASLWPKAPTICDRGADVDVSLSTVSMLGWRLGVVRCDFRLDCGPQLLPPALHTFRSFVYALTLSSLLVFRFRLPSNPATSRAVDFPTLAVGAGPYLF